MKHSLRKKKQRRDNKIETPKSDPKRIKPSNLETNGTKSLSKTLPSNRVSTKPIFQKPIPKQKKPVKPSNYLFHCINHQNDTYI